MSDYQCIAPDVKLGTGVKLARFVNLYGCDIGDETKIGAFVEIQKNAKVGRRCKISSHTFICEGVTIEDQVFIGHGVTFINDPYPRATNSAGELQSGQDWTVERTLVKHGASIGSGATIMCNVVIGQSAIVGAGSLVTRDVPDNAIVAGAPARLLRSLPPDSEVACSRPSGPGHSEDVHMLGFDFDLSKDRALRILCLGAHSDDIEIGCGGTMLRLLAEYPRAEVYWVVLGSSGERDAEAIASAGRFLADAGRKDVIVKNFKRSFFPYVGDEIKEFFEKLKMEISPDVIFTHYRNDLHQDHRLVSELTWNTYRNHLILEYEIIKYDGDIGVPNFFVHLDEAICRKKIGFIMEFFNTQRDKDWFSPDAFLSLLRLRGVESKAPGNYAEAFYCRKVIL